MIAANSKGTRVSRKQVCALFCFLFAALAAQAELKPETTAAYQKYIAALDTQMAAQNHSQSGFLWIDRDAGRQQAVRRGEIVTQKVKSLSVPDGMIQHWIGGVFLPGATLAQVVRVDQDYADYGKIYGSDVSRVKVISHDGNHFVVAYRITKTKVLTAVMDTVHAIDYVPLGPTRMAMQSRSESVRQGGDAGEASDASLARGR